MIVVDRPATFALVSAFANQVIGVERNLSLVIPDPSVSEPAPGERVDRPLLSRRRRRVVPQHAVPLGLAVGDQVEADLLVSQRVVEPIAGELPFVLAAMLKDDVAPMVVLDDRVDVPLRAGSLHGVLGPQLSPAQVEAFLVAINMLGDEVRVLGVPEHIRSVSAAAFVDQVLARLEGPLVLGLLDHVVYAKDLPDVGLERPAGIVWPKVGASPEVLWFLEQVGRVTQMLGKYLRPPPAMTMSRWRGKASRLGMCESTYRLANCRRVSR